jgi:hypothetical protein
VVTADAWLGAAPGQPPKAAQVNQLLGVHRAQHLYAGVLTAGQNTPGSGFATTNSVYNAQSFTTAAGQTAVGYVTLQVGATTGLGSVLAPLVLSLYASAGGAPTGSPLVSVTVSAEYSYAAPSVMVAPLPVAGLTPSTTYWLVSAPVGDATNHYFWNKSTQVSGASTSPNGTTWTAQAYGLTYQVFDQTASGLLTCTWEDAGARWTWLAYNATGGINQVTTYAEYTAAQNGSYVQSFRSLAYSSGLLTKVA